MDTTPSYPVDRLSKRRLKGVRASASPRKSNKSSASIDSSDAGVASAILRYALSTNSPLSNSALPSSNTSTTNTTISFTDMPAPPAGEFHLHGLAPTAPTPSTQPHNSSEGSIPGLQLGKENTPSNNASSDQGSSSHKGSGVPTTRPKVLVPNTVTPVPGKRTLPASSPLKMTTRAIRGASALRAKANPPPVPLASTVPAMGEAGPSPSPSRRSARIQKRGSDEATVDSGSATQRSSYSNPEQSQDSVVGLGYADARPLSLSSGQRTSPTQSFGNVLVKATPTSSWESSQTQSDPSVSQPPPPQLPRPVSPTPEQPPVSLSLPFSLPSSDDNPDGVEDDDSIFRPSIPATRAPQRPFVPHARRHLPSGVPNTFTTSASSALSTPLEIGSATQIDEQLQQVDSKESSVAWLGAPTQLATEADVSMLDWSHDPLFQSTQPNEEPMLLPHNQALAERNVAAVVALLTAPITPAAAHAWVGEATQPAIESPQLLRRRLPTLAPPSLSGSQPIPGLQAPAPTPQSPPAHHRAEPVPAPRRISDPRKAIRHPSPLDDADDAPSVHLLELAEVAAMRTPVRPGPNTSAAQGAILVPDTTSPSRARGPGQEQRANSDDAHPPHPQTLHTPKRLAQQKQLSRDMTPTIADMDTDEYRPSASPTTGRTGQKRKRTGTQLSSGPARATRSTPASNDLPPAKRRKPNEGPSRKPSSKLPAPATAPVQTNPIGTRVLIQWTDKAWYPGYVAGPVLKRGRRVLYPVCFDDDVLNTPPVPLAKLRKLHLKKGDRVNVVKIIDQDRDIVGDAEVSDASAWDGGAGEVEVDFGVEGEKVMARGFHFKVDARNVKEGWDDRKLTEDQIFGPGEEGGDSVVDPTPPSVPLPRVVSRSSAAPIPPSRKLSSTSNTRSTTTSRPLSSNRSFSTLPPSTAFRRKGFLITNEKGSITSSRILAAGGTVFQSWSQVFEWHASVTMSGSWVAGLSDIVLEPGVLNGEGECGGDGVDSVFLIAECPVMTPKYLLALALGIPCVSNVWVTDCWQRDEDQANDWHSYLLSAGRAEHLNAECSQWVDQTWGSDPSQLQNLMSNPIVKRIFKGKTFLCVGYQPHKMLPPEENPYPFILSSMGAAAVHVVADRSAAPLNTHFDYILSKEDAAANTSTSMSIGAGGGGVAGGNNGVSASVAGNSRAAAGGRATRGGGGRDAGPRGTTSSRRGAGTAGETPAGPEAIDERWIKQCLITRGIAPAP